MAFLAALMLTLPVASAIYSSGAEYVAVGELFVLSPRSGNSLVDSARSRYSNLASIAAEEIESKRYSTILAADGILGTITVDFTTEWPVVRVLVRSPTRSDARRAIASSTERFITVIESKQQERDINSALWLRAEVGSLFFPPARPAGSRRALFATVLASVFIAGAVAYALDQFWPS